MAGTIVADTLQNGAGTSTSMTNAITGSAKVWVNFNGTSGAINGTAFNVSSVTRNGTGDYTVNFTTAMPNTNYVVTGACQYVNTGSQTNQNIVFGINDGSGNFTTTTTRVSTKASSTSYDCAIVMVGILSS